jgi:hypothetical protein
MCERRQDGAQPFFFSPKHNNFRIPFPHFGRVGPAIYLDFGPPELYPHRGKNR